VCLLVKIELFSTNKNPVIWAGFFLLTGLLVTGCQVPKQPEQVTVVFWQALLRNDIDQAKQWVTEKTKSMVKPLDVEGTEYSISTGRIIIEKPRARVEAFLKQKNTTQQFTTYLQFENHAWKVDYARTFRSFSGDVFEGLVQRFEQLGEQLNQQLEKEILPQLQQEFETFGEQLKQQLDQFNQNLNKFLQPPAKKTVPLTPGQRRI
jgi:hypothetical protein